jgi:hypothetical protein
MSILNTNVDPLEMSSANKTDCHDNTEILLKVALNTTSTPQEGLFRQV